MPPENTSLDDLLDEILAAYLKADSGSRPALQRQLLADHPELMDELQSFFDSQDRFQQLASPLRAAFSRHSGQPAGTVIGGYEILAEIARGGMGIVYRAKSLMLGRVVALKMLRPGSIHHVADEQRFRTEAGAVADLDCPNIVPIYEVGEDENHQAFFAMKWMPGGSLAQRLADFRWPHPTDKATLPPAEKKQRVLHLLTSVARAVHHAHTRGILHRDLKPANILLDADDTPYVSDFGLAKRFNPTDSNSGPTDTPNGSALTESGLIVGTPSYMAPEQAAGKSGAVSVASDVYSLGAILYELLTGRPPFRGETTWDTLRQLMSDEPGPVRSLNPWVDHDLETICHKCLHKDPGQRYTSAADLADDLERHGRGEPILARPVRPWERFWRWCRRNPGLSAASALAVASLIVIAVVSIIFAIREADHASALEQAVLQKEEALKQAKEEQKKAVAGWAQADKHRQEAEEQKKEVEEQKKEVEQQKMNAMAGWLQAAANHQEAEKQKDLADASFLTAHQVVFKFCNNLSKELSTRPELLPLRKALLETALDYYKGFLEQRAGDPKLENELADAYKQMGRILELIGSKNDALQAYQQALVLAQKMRSADPDNPELRHKVGGALLAVGASQQGLGKHADAQQTYNLALDLYRQLVDDFPKDVRFSGSAAAVGNNLAALYRDLGETDKALDLLKEVVGQRKKQLAADPKSVAAISSLALSLNNLGVIQMNVGKSGDAKTSFQEALDLRQKLVNFDSKNSAFKIALAASYRDLGAAQMGMGQQEEGVKNWTKALQLREQMAKEHFKIGYFQADLASSYQDFGSLHRDKKEYPEAIGLYKKARDIWDKLLKLDPGIPSYQNAGARCDHQLALLHGLLNQHDEEKDYFAKALATQEKLVQSYPQAIDFHNDYAQTLHGWGLAQQSSDVPAAEQALRLAVKHKKIVMDRAPGVPGYRKTLSIYYTDLSNLLRGEGQVEEALQLLLERRKLWPKNAEALYLVARDLAKAAQSLDDATQRGRHEALAVETLKMARAAGFADLKRLLAEPAFKPLHQRDDFKSLKSQMTK